MVQRRKPPAPGLLTLSLAQALESHSLPIQSAPLGLIERGRATHLQETTLDLPLWGSDMFLSQALLKSTTLW